MISVSDEYYVRTCYVSRVVDLPPLVAQAAYDAQFRDRDGGDRPVVLSVAAGRMLAAQVPQVPSPPGYHPLRVHPATVRAGLRRRAVELELWPWSGERSELGLRPVDRVFGRVPADQLLRTCHDLLDQFAASLRRWADQPLRELTAEIGSATTSSPNRVPDTRSE